MQVKQLLEQVFPGIEVAGTTYPLSPSKRLLVQAVSAAQMGALGLVFAGDRLFSALGVPPPAWYVQRVQQSKPTAAIGVWLVGNMVGGSLQSTGAFEIYYDGRLVGFFGVTLWGDAGRLLAVGGWGRAAVMEHFFLH